MVVDFRRSKMGVPIYECIHCGDEFGYLPMFDHYFTVHPGDDIRMVRKNEKFTDADGREWIADHALDDLFM
jgi:hypothetical protein